MLVLKKPERRLQAASGMERILQGFEEMQHGGRLDSKEAREMDGETAERERETERETETETDRDRERQRETETETDRQTEKDRQTDSETLRRNSPCLQWNDKHEHATHTHRPCIKSGIASISIRPTNAIL